MRDFVHRSAADGARLWHFRRHDDDASTYHGGGGRNLDVFVVGGRCASGVRLPGTPEGHVLFPSVEEASALAGIRIVSLARPGYAGSTRMPGRRVADVVPDVLAVVDALGVQRFAVVGSSGGGPHALACGALCGDRCVAVAVVSGVGPWAAEGLDFLAGMGESNQVEFGAALRAEAPLRELRVPWREEMVSAGVDGTFAAMQSVLSPPDQEVFTGLWPSTCMRASAWRYTTGSMGGSTTTWPSPRPGGSTWLAFARPSSCGRGGRTSWCPRPTGAGSPTPYQSARRGSWGLVGNRLTPPLAQSPDAARA